ncbi:hypothetical protein [Streptomyces wuyuanensis]|uniref:hypothetical protein n=1 Tax=Streptomyces wuyuanensis TaxID=1196353 RepID=UPI00370F9D34
MLTTAAPPRATRVASLAFRARNIVDSGLCTRIRAVPDWAARLDQLHHLAELPAAARRDVLRRLHDDVLIDVMVLSYLRTGTPFELWADTRAGYTEDVLGVPAAPGSARSRLHGWFAMPTPTLSAVAPT